MGNQLSYSGTTTKIRSLHSKLFTMDNYRELASSTNVTEALSYLKRHPAYHSLFENMEETSLHRGEIEKILTNGIYQDFQKIYRFSPVRQRIFLDIYFRRYEVALLKSCLRMIFDRRDVSLDMKIFENFFKKHSDIDLGKITASRTIEEFVSNLNDTIYYDTLCRLDQRNHPTLWDYEMAIDLFYFQWFFRTGKKEMDREELRHFKKAYGIKMDLLNINWIYRSKHFFKMSSADIYAHLISEEYYLQKEDIQALVESNGQEEFTAALKKTFYGKYYEQCNAETLSRTYDHIRHTIQRKEAAKDPYSVATVISYLYEKDHEIDRITTVLEGVRYGLSQNEILEHIKY